MLLIVASSYFYCKHRATLGNSTMLGMKTCDEVRLENLRRLVEEAQGLSNLIAKANGKLSRPVLYQILSGVKTAAGTPKNIGDDLARKIEKELRLERGWMDHEKEFQDFLPQGYIMPAELIRLITLYSQADRDGRDHILGVLQAAVSTSTPSRDDRQQR